jgi:hypothetical protein
LSIYLTLDNPDKPDAQATALVAPETETPPIYFGPSASVTTKTISGTEHKAMLWLGGKGLAEDGRWGDMFVFTFEIGTNGTAPPGFVAGVLLDNYRNTLIERYGEESAAILLKALPAVVRGRIYDRPLTSGEIMETFQ